MSERAKLRVEVISDVVCPWCYVGKRRLDAAIAQVADRIEVQVGWNPFQLSPELPQEGREWEPYAKERFGSLERMREMQARLVEVGKEEGIPFAYDRIRRACNTFDAHRLLWLSYAGGTQHDVAERLFLAYFVEGEDIGDRDVLVRIGVAAGLDEQAVRTALEGDVGKEEVRYGLAEARQLGVQAVPFFVIGGRFGLSGAQPPEVLVELMERAVAEES